MERRDVPALGTIPPPFELPSADGTLISLANLHRERLALIVFYRGWW